MARAVLIIGGNIGEMKPRLRQAQKMINDEAGIVMRCSHTYDTEAWGFKSESRFTNQVLVVDTDLTPEQLLVVVQSIEGRMGRDREQEKRLKERSGERYSSRVIDIDILLYDDRVIETSDLVVPHPLLHERTFVLRPLCELMRDKVHPVLGKTMGQLYAELTSREEEEV